MTTISQPDNRTSEYFWGGLARGRADLGSYAADFNASESARLALKQVMGTDAETEHCEHYTHTTKWRVIGCWESNMNNEIHKRWINEEDINRSSDTIFGIAADAYIRFGGNISLGKERIINNYLVDNILRITGGRNFRGVVPTVILDEIAELLDDATISNPSSRFAIEVEGEVPVMLTPGEEFTLNQPDEGETVDVFIKSFISAESTGVAWRWDLNDGIEISNSAWYTRKYNDDDGVLQLEDYFVDYSNSIMVSIDGFYAKQRELPTLGDDDVEYVFRGFRCRLSNPVVTTEEEDES